MILTKCSCPNCRQLCAKGERYCDKHKDYDKQKYKQYRNKRMADDYEKALQQFYNSKAWKKLRDSIVVRDKGCCLLCLLEEGILEPMYTVHHIREIREYIDGRLLGDNLVCLCQHHHMKVHEEYNKGTEEKKAMQDLLFKLIQLTLTEIDKLYLNNNM